MSRIARILVWGILCSPAVCCLGGLLTIGGATKRIQRSIAAQIAEAKRLGLPTTSAELTAYKAVAPEDNAATVYEMAFQLFPDKSTLYQTIRKVTDGKATFASHQADLKPLLDIVDRAVEKPSCRFPRDYDQGAALLFPEFAQLKLIEKLLMRQAADQSSKGDWKGSLATLSKMHRVADQANSDPVIIAALIQIACESITEKQVRDSAADFASNRTALDAAIKMESTPLRLPNWRDSIAGELVLGRATLRSVKSLSDLTALTESFETPIPSSIVNVGIRSAYMRASFEDRYLKQQIRTFKDLPDDPNDFKAVEVALKSADIRVERDSSPLGYWNMILNPVLSGLTTAAPRVVAEQRLTRTYLRLLRQGKPFPASLPAWGSDTIDPFTVKPLRYRRDGSGFVVYSVGSDRVDDGGKNTREGRSKDVIAAYP